SVTILSSPPSKPSRISTHIWGNHSASNSIGCLPTFSTLPHHHGVCVNALYPLRGPALPGYSALNRAEIT
ncbi:hypothetical protein BJV74DRAFT_985878, partial [Russula compacta]